MKKKFLLLIAFASVSVYSQIYTGTGGGSSILPNSTTTNLNVGIGTDNPEYLLDVNGDIRGKRASFSKSVPDGTVFANANEEYIESNVLSAGTIVDQAANSKTFNFFDFGSNSTKPSRIWFSLQTRDDIARLVLSASRGGSTNFTLYDKNQSEFFKLNDDGNNSAYMQLGKSDSRVVIGGWSNDPAGIGNKLFVKNGSAKIEGNILTDSNIGIGTSSFVDGSNTYRLSVRGKVRAEEVKVYNTWADYVLEENYKLPTLDEVEKYIKENGHLINVPSAKEITKEGLMLGEITKIQQEKIEELTLYLIQQNKEIEKLKQEIKELANNKN